MDGSTNSVAIIKGKKMFNTRHKLFGLVIVNFVVLSFPVNADRLNDTISIESSTNNAAIQSQKKIDKLSDQAQKMLEQYRATSHHTETLLTYNRHLNDLLKSQKSEKISIEQQLTEIETTQREIVPLILNMLDSLEKFIALDLPFLSKERSERITKLKEMVLRADVTNAEKFRRILEAYQIENDYGNTIEAYRADLTIDGETRAVDFLRLGRVALYYQRFDGSEIGYWNKEEKKWQQLSSEYRNSIRNGLRIARKEMAPDILSLPIPAAEAAK